MKLELFLLCARSRRLTQKRNHGVRTNRVRRRAAGQKKPYTRAYEIHCTISNVSQAIMTAFTVFASWVSELRPFNKNKRLVSCTRITHKRCAKLFLGKEQNVLKISTGTFVEVFFMLLLILTLWYRHRHCLFFLWYLFKGFRHRIKMKNQSGGGDCVGGVGWTLSNEAPLD